MASFVAIFTLVLCLSWSQANILDRRMTAVEYSWDNLTNIGETPVDEIHYQQWLDNYARYMSNAPVLYEVEVTEVDFNVGWALDFNRTFNTLETAAYFRIFNMAAVFKNFVHDDDFMLIHSLTDADWDGVVNETEFNTRFPFVLRPITWGVMHLRADINADGVLDLLEFQALFMEWDFNLDGEVTQPEFVQYWTHVQNDYGDEESGIAAHVGLDFNDDWIIDDYDIDELYWAIDANFDLLLSFEEWLNIDILVYGWPWSDIDGKHPGHKVTGSHRLPWTAPRMTDRADSRPRRRDTGHHAPEPIPTLY